MRILITDDDPHIAELITLYLTKEGYETRICHNGRQAVSEAFSFAPNLILLDIMLPDMDGYAVCREVRKQSSVPIIMLTAKNDTIDKVLGLEMGADDYIVKPFDAKELVARVRAVLRRTEAPKDANPDYVIFPNLLINQNSYNITYHGQVLEMPPKEFELLLYLAKHPNQLFTRDRILNAIWGYDFFGDSRTVDVHIKRLRQKLNKKDAWSIKTIHGKGYKFDYLP